MKKHILAVLTAITIVSHADSEVVDRIAAVVNDNVITLSELDAEINAVLGGLKDEAIDKNSPEVRSKVLDGLIEKILIKETSEKMGIEVSEKEIDNAIEDVKKANNLTHESMLILLLRNGLTYNEYRNQMKEEIRQAKFINNQFRSRINIEDAPAVDYYKQNAERFIFPPSYHLRIIVLPSKDEPLKKKRLSAVMEGLRQGRSFSELAVEYSEDRTAKDGGDMGFLISGELEPFMEDAAKKLKKDEVSEPIEAKSALYIIQLADKKENERIPFEEVKQDIKNILFKKLLEEKYLLWLEEMKKIAHIEIRL